MLLEYLHLLDSRIRPDHKVANIIGELRILQIGFKLRKLVPHIRIIIKVRRRLTLTLIQMPLLMELAARVPHDRGAHPVGRPRLTKLRLRPHPVHHGSPVVHLVRVDYLRSLHLGVQLHVTLPSELVIIVVDHVVGPGIDVEYGTVVAVGLVLQIIESDGL